MLTAPANLHHQHHDHAIRVRIALDPTAGSRRSWTSLIAGRLVG